MAAGAVLAIVVAAGELSAPTTIALRLAAEESLGGAVEVRVVEASNLRAVDAVAIERSLGARAVAVLAWREPASLHAVLRVHLAGGDRWTQRAITFSPQDSVVERGRTLGLAVASSWPEPARSRGSPPGKDSAPADHAETREERAPRPQAEPDASAAAAPAPPSRQREATAEPPEAREPTRHASRPPETVAAASTPAVRPAPARPGRAGSLAVGASGVAALGLGGPASGLGAALEATVPFADVLALRLGAELRTGPVAPLPGTDLVAALAAGLEWWPSPRRRGTIGLRGDFVALWHAVSTTASGENESHGRLLPGADLAVQGRFRATARLDLVAALGLEVAFGTTELRTGPSSGVVAAIPPLRAASHIGLRVRF